ncbi:MAG: hypothetical protein KBT34_13260 [Prevotella sp.]|nr:hypothetical protein [Candidatus Prevotella equi]
MSNKTNIYQALKQELDSVRDTVAVLIDEVKDVSNSLTDISVSVDEQSLLQEKAFALLSRMNDNGIGFSEIASQIALPLIIALLAFAFPFVFSVINHINAKYESPAITALFNKSSSSKLFWWFTYGSVLSLIAISVYSFVLPYNKYEQIADLILLIVSIGYLITIVAFVRRCIKFNKADGVMSAIIDERTYDQRGSCIKVKWFSFLKWLSKIIPFKDKVWKDSKSFKYNYITRSWKQNPNALYTNRMIEIAKYTLRVHDVAAFNGIMRSMQNIFDEEKNEQDGKGLISESGWMRKTLEFFEEITTYYNSCQKDKDIEDTLVQTFVFSYNSSLLPKYGMGIDMLRLWRKVKSEALLGKYIKWSKYYFRYITRLSQVACVRGGDIAYQQSIEKKASEKWDEFCNYHYLLFAYHVQAGNYGLLRYLLSPSHYGQYNLYPITAEEILNRYSKCKDKVSEENYFSHYTCSDLFDTNFSLNDALDRYTAALLLLSKQDGRYILRDVKLKDIEHLREYQSAVETHIKMLKSDNDFVRLYPNIINEDVKAKVENAIGNLRMAVAIPEPKKQEEPKTGNLLEKLKECKRKKVQEASKDFYNETIVRGLEDSINERLASRSGNSYEQTLLSMFPTHSKEEPFTYKIPDSSLSYSKWLFIDNSNEDYLSRTLIYDVTDLKQNVMMGGLLKILSEQTVEKKIMDSGSFHSYFIDLTKGHADDYVILDIDGHLKAIDIMVFNRDYNHYEGSLYLDAETVIFGLLRDTPEYNYFKNSIVIVKKSDLPTLEFVKGKTSPSVKFHDESNKAESEFKVRVKVDFGLAMHYNKNGIVRKIQYKGLLHK